MIKRIGFAIIALAFTVFGVAVAQQWPNVPILGGASYCSSTVNAVCVSTVPAGPTVVTGAETVPADTNVSGGTSPQTVKVPLTALGSGATQLITTNASFTIANGVSNIISNQGAATIALITMPAAPVQGQSIHIANAGSGILTITSLAANTGQTIVQGAAPASLAIQTTNTGVASGLSFVEYKYFGTVWYRVQ